MPTAPKSMPPWPGSRTTINGPSPRGWGSGTAAAGGSAQSGGSGWAAAVAKASGVAGPRRRRTVAPCPPVSIPPVSIPPVSIPPVSIPPVSITAVSTCSGTRRSITSRDQPGRKLPARRSETSALSTFSAAMPDQSTSRKSMIRRRGSSATRTRHGTGWLSESVMDSLSPSSAMEDPATSNRARAERSCAAAGSHDKSTRPKATNTARMSTPCHFGQYRGSAPPCPFTPLSEEGRKAASRSGEKALRALNPDAPPL